MPLATARASWGCAARRERSARGTAVAIASGPGAHQGADDDAASARRSRAGAHRQPHDTAPCAAGYMTSIVAYIRKEEYGTLHANSRLLLHAAVGQHGLCA